MSDPQPERLDIHYVDDGMPEHTLDIFTPQGSGPFPVLVWAHGGGWRAGEKADLANTDIHMDEMKQALLEHGYAIASVNYRLAPANTFPAPTHDIAASVRYLKAHAAEFGLDPERFALGGDSAGAHLSSLVAMAAGDETVQGTLGETSTDSKVDAVVGYYGLYDLRGRIPDQQAQGCDPERTGADSSHGQLIGADPGSEQGGKIADSASPLTYINEQSPAMIMFAGRQDCTAPFAQAERMRDALQKASVPTELTIIDTGHADPKFFQDEAIRNQMLSFLDAHVS
ncbi:alpha/beta hydrolase [Gephyromycinifex aptenodytis]|uniref:alpha/beta hydrolase n=1 Tax=Gephyromycinifex aptenodytis TaxID=2716227 RepID=UPI001D020FD9|nr:alpha/beta hydrolase [Gephyromycinifex aptenodytis]